MKKCVATIALLFSNLVLAQSVPSIVAFTPEEIVNEKVNKVNQQNNMGESPEATISIFKSAQDTNGVNLATASKVQKVGIDLYSEGEGLRSAVLDDQTNSGAIQPQGCGDASVLSQYQANQCLAADTLQVMSVEVISTESDFRSTADKAYQTMDDVSELSLNGSNSSFFSANSHGVPTESNFLYSSNTSAINGMNSMFKALDSKSEYKGMKYNTQKDFFYLGGKKYASSVLLSKDGMLKAGIDPSLANFVYKMLEKKSSLAQSKISAILKSKKFYDGKNWSIYSVNGLPNQADTYKNGNPNYPTNTQPVIPTQPPIAGEAQLSSSLVEDLTLYKQVNGVPVGLSSDNIFKIVSRRYREKDRMGFFHSSPKK